MIKFSQAPKSLCIFRLSAIGDVTHILPVIHTLKKVWPQTEITWIIGKLEYQLVKSLPGIEFIEFGKSDGLKAYSQLRNQLKGRKFDVLLMMQVALRASIASLLIPARYKLGFDRQRAADFQWLFSNYRISGDYRVHVLEGFFQFLRTMGIEKHLYDWNLPISPEDINHIEKMHLNSPYVVINPCSSARRNNWRNWPAARYAEIIDYLSSKNFQIVLSGGTSRQEVKFGQSISSQCQSKVVDLIGLTSLGELLVLLQNASFVIAPDTGPAHMATIVDTPVIGLFASSNPLRTGPYKSQQILVNRYEDALRQYNHKNLEEATWGERVRNPGVMNLISVDDVVQNIDKLLS